MSGAVTPPHVGDVLLAGQAYGFPPLEGEGVSIPAGEEAWRLAVTPDTAGLIWETLHEANLEEGAAADADDDDEDGAG